jgi:hypothetical protein
MNHATLNPQIKRMPTQKQRDRWWKNLCKLVEPDEEGMVPYHDSDPGAGTTRYGVERFVLIQDNDYGERCVMDCPREQLESRIAMYHDEEGWTLSHVVDLETGQEVKYAVGITIMIPEGG